MLTIDGTDGGGQILRTALSLSVITDTPVEIEAIRGNRPKPGLKPSHLTCVELLAEFCAATVDGATLEADALTFEPGDECQPTLSANIGTAGSVTLLFDTVLPIAAALNEPFEVRATGGTDVKWSPTVAFHQQVKLPLLEAWGVAADIELVTSGFFPAGGGEAVLRTTPGPLTPNELTSRGPLDRVEVFSKAAKSLEEREVADRQATQAETRLREAGVPVTVRDVDYVAARSTGSALLLRGVYENSVVGFDALGEQRRSSEAVADGAVEEFLSFHDAGDAGAPVDAHLADQLMVVLALAGGELRIPRVTAHVRTNLAVISAFGSDMTCTEHDDGTATLRATPLRTA